MQFSICSAVLLKLLKGQSKYKVGSKVISWGEKGQLLEKSETRVKAREARSMFDPEVFKMKDRVLMFTTALNKNQIGEMWWCFATNQWIKKLDSILSQILPSLASSG